MIGQDIAAVVFGLASALSWGAGDFSGGLATKRVPVWTVVVIGHSVGLLLMVGLALLWGESLPPRVDLIWGFAAGIAGVVGIVALYQALPQRFPQSTRIEAAQLEAGKVWFLTDKFAEAQPLFAQAAAGKTAT